MAITQHAESKNAKRRGVWQCRGRRVAVGSDVLISAVLALVLLVMVNHLAHRYPLRWNLSSRDYYRLSKNTVSMIAALDGKVNIVAFYRKNHILCDDVVNLLREYEYQGSLNKDLDLGVTIVDPDRDLARNRIFSEKYDVEDTNIVVFEKDGRRKYVGASDIAEYALRMNEKGAFTKLVGFKAEEAFSSALLSITQEEQSKVYFLIGHGERDIQDFRGNAGYSQLARMMHRDNIETVRLLPAEHKGIPQDCDALVIPGPDRQLMREEIDWCAQYLGTGGRVFLLIDPAVNTGLDRLLAEWGVQLARDVVVDPYHTLTGRELLVNEYGEHAVTRPLKNVATVFYMPRSVVPLNRETLTGNGTQADRPQVTVLAGCSDRGWAEMNLSQSPAAFDEQADVPGPIPVALTVEKGGGGEIEVGIRPTRLIVVGDSDFVSNGALSSGVGGNLDFFMSGLNWLLERDALMAVRAKPPLELRLSMNRGQLRLATIIIVGAMPCLLMILGAIVWRKRRY